LRRARETGKGSYPLGPLNPRNGEGYHRLIPLLPARVGETLQLLKPLAHRLGVSGALRLFERSGDLLHEPGFGVLVIGEFSQPDILQR
jgi:hypothetical protein